MLGQQFCRKSRESNCFLQRKLFGIRFGICEEEMEDHVGDTIRDEFRSRSDSRRKSVAKFFLSLPSVDVFGINSRKMSLLFIFSHQLYENVTDSSLNFAIFVTGKSWFLQC